MDHLNEWKANSNEFAKLFLERMRRQPLHSITQMSIASVISSMMAETQGSGWRDEIGKQDFIMKSSVPETSKISKKEEIIHFAEETYLNIRKLFEKDRHIGPEIRTKIQKKFIINGFLIAYGYEPLEESLLNNMNKEDLSQYDVLREDFDELEVTQNDYPEFEESEFEELDSEVEGHSDWTPDMDEEIDTYEDDEFDPLGDMFEDEYNEDYDPEDYDLSGEEDYFTDDDLDELQEAEETEKQKQARYRRNNRAAEKEARDEAARIKANNIRDRKRLAAEKKPKGPKPKKESQLYEGGKRVNMSQETIDSFVHQLLLIPDAARRQAVVDEIFKKIAEENQKAYEKSQAKLNKTEEEVKEDLKESKLKEMVTECQLCGKVFDSHEEGHIINDGVLIDTPACDACYEKYTDYN